MTCNWIYVSLIVLQVNDSVVYSWIYINLILHLKTPAWEKVQGPVLIHDESGLDGIKKKKSMQVMDAFNFPF